jgi:hypothetical protein
LTPCCSFVECRPLKIRVESPKKVGKTPKKTKKKQKNGSWGSDGSGDTAVGWDELGLGSRSFMSKEWDCLSVGGWLC